MRTLLIIVAATFAGLRLPAQVASSGTLTATALVGRPAIAVSVSRGVEMPMRIGVVQPIEAPAALTVSLPQSAAYELTMRPDSAWMRSTDPEAPPKAASDLLWCSGACRSTRDYRPLAHHEVLSLGAASGAGARAVTLRFRLRSDRAAAPRHHHYTLRVVYLVVID